MCSTALARPAITAPLALPHTLLPSTAGSTLLHLLLLRQRRRLPHTLLPSTVGCSTLLHALLLLLRQRRLLPHTLLPSTSTLLHLLLLLLLLLLLWRRQLGWPLLNCPRCQQWLMRCLWCCCC
jgi:hypothetical protein